MERLSILLIEFSWNHFVPYISNNVYIWGLWRCFQVFPNITQDPRSRISNIMLPIVILHQNEIVSQTHLFLHFDTEFSFQDIYVYFILLQSCNCASTCYAYTFPIC